MTTAATLRDISKQATTTGELITAMYEYTMSRCVERARTGCFECPFPLLGFPSPYSKEQYDALLDKLRANGFKVEHVISPESNDPRYQDYDLIKWKE